MKLFEIYAKLPPRADKSRPIHNHQYPPSIENKIKNLPEFVKHINVIKTIANRNDAKVEFSKEKHVTIFIFKNNRIIKIIYTLKSIFIIFIDKHNTVNEITIRLDKTEEDFKNKLKMIENDISKFFRYLNDPDIDFKTLKRTF